MKSSCNINWNLERNEEIFETFDFIGLRGNPKNEFHSEHAFYAIMCKENSDLKLALTNLIE